MLRGVSSAVLLFASTVATPLMAEDCSETGCKVRMTAPQLLATAEQLVAEKRFGEAAPMLAALENAPELDMQRRFLIGYSASERGDLDTAIGEFRKILESSPTQTRVRLELAKALMMKGKSGAADYHFRLAQGDDALPPEIAATVRASRRLLRDSREFAFNVDFGFAPDTNITNGTRAETVDIAFGNETLPLTLDSQARQKSGVGQTLGFSSAARLTIGEETRLLIEGTGNLVNYKGKSFDDINAQLAIGPEFALGDETRLSVQAVGSQRWYGGRNAQRGGGLRTSLMHNLGNNDRIGLSLDARRNQSGFDSGNSGWQFAAAANYEMIVAKSFVASGSLFARRDLLNSKAFSGTEMGVNVGIGGELPLGIVAGVSTGVTRAAYDAPVALFGSTTRKDWRANARVQFGLRSIRVLGFSPSVSYTFLKTKSNLELYTSQRHRFQFAVARYF